MRTTRFLLSVVAMILLSGCAAVTPGSRQMDAALSSLGTLEAAEAMFGPPAMKEELSADRVSAVWEFDRLELVPGQYVDTQQYVGHDRDGFPVHRRSRYWVPQHLEERYCHVNITADYLGRVQGAYWEGNACDRLLTPAGRESAYAESDVMPLNARPDRVRRVPISPFWWDEYW